MSNYIIDWWSNGSQSIPGKESITLVQKGVDSTSTSLVLTGKGVPNYGEIQQENFIRLLENFASNTPPINPTIGQLWFKADDNVLYVRVDPLLSSVGIPLYSLENDSAWVQVWPSRQEYAGVREYNSLATTINRIIGAPSTYGTGTLPGDNEYGWGQTDLVPVYTDASTLAPGFTNLGFPEQFDNNSWAIALSRLRKALRHVEGGTEENVSPFGFIDDGRPKVGGNTIANTYNSYPSPGTQPNYESGWGGYGFAGMNFFYTATVQALTDLIANRFRMKTLSSESQVLTTATRTSSWESTKIHNIDVTFASETAAKSFFNAGGHFRFELSLTPSVSDAFNDSWVALLSEVNDLIFDYRGVRFGNNYWLAPDLSSQSYGFYDLTSTAKVIFSRDRVSGAYTQIADGGIQIEALTENGPSGFKIKFQVSFVEGFSAGETVSGETKSALWAQKPSALNVNSPTIAYPVGSGSGSFME